MTTERILIVEARSGVARRGWMEQRLRESAGPGARTFLVSCEFDLGGPWGGVNGFFAPLLDEIERNRPDLFEAHLFELAHVFPRLRKSHVVRNPSLTDQAPPEEKVRNYPVDRAFRIVHGLIDLLDSWKSATCPDEPWLIACDGYDGAGAMTSRFFRELMRRRGNRLRLNLIAAVEPGQGERIRAAFDSALAPAIVTMDLPADGPQEMDPAEAARLAKEIEQRIGDDGIEQQVHLPELIRLWGLAGRPDRILYLKAHGLDIYTTLGLYEDTLRYADGLLALAAEHTPPDSPMKWALIVKTLNCLVGLGDAQAGLKLAEGEALEVAGNDHFRRGQLFYLIAMLYARYQQPRNLGKGEQYLEEGLAELEQSSVADEERHFQCVFNRNGLAMIRSFQGRPQEAIELCRSGIARLTAHLGAGKHRLHRSVLMYNIAQVYVATGSYADAIEYYSAAMAMDPNYSEYYNERAGIFLRLGRFEEARADYLRAIEVSPPYFEVFTNLGQCYRRMGAMAEAIESYSRALDLEPAQPLALLGRAKAHEELGHRDAAIADYTAALARDSKQWEAIASRGVLHYEAGDLQLSLADFDRALELAPGEAALYQNRAIVLKDLGRREEAARDLEAAGART